MSDTQPTLLVIDDERSIFPILEQFSAARGFAVHVRESGEEGLAALATLKPNVALVDVQMPGINGLEVLRGIKAGGLDCDVILMSGDTTVDTAIEAVKAGALDYLRKPFDFGRLGALLDGVAQRLQGRERLLDAEAALARQFEFHGMIGRSAVMQLLFDRIRRLAPHVRTVLITGETGTGKELVAKALHAAGARPHQRFLTVNCAAVVETLFESELFGHVRGAFTGATETKVGLFEHASGGTLFLDEAGELPLALQAKLLRAVENGEVQRVGSLDTRKADVCVIAATNRNLQAEAHAGRFRSDLYYRLSIIEIDLPPLRSRREDIPYLVAAFVREFAARLKRTITGVTTSAERRLHEAPWPGNIRELRNVIERACILTESRLLTEGDVAAAMSPRGDVSAEAPSPLTAPPADTSLLSSAQRDRIQRVLAEVGGNKAAAAKRLGISRRSIYRWLERLDLGA